MDALKMLMDAPTIEGENPPFNVSQTDETTIVAITELERLGIVAIKGATSDVVSCSITKSAANTLETITLFGFI